MARRNTRLPRQSAFRAGTLLSRGLTLSVVMVGWIFFGTQTAAIAFQYLWRMLTWRTDGVVLGSPYILPLTVIVVLAHLFINKDRNMVEELPTYSVPTRVFAYSTMLFVLTSLVASEAVPFVYVRF